MLLLDRQVRETEYKLNGTNLLLLFGHVFSFLRLELVIMSDLIKVTFIQTNDQLALRLSHRLKHRHTDVRKRIILPEP